MELCDSLGVGLLQQGHPELVRVDTLGVEERSVLGGESVIDVHVHPRAEPPEAEPHAAAVTGPAQRLARRYHLPAEVRSGQVRSVAGQEVPPAGRGQVRSGQ